MTLAKIEAEKVSLLPTNDEWSRLKDICSIAVKSGLIPQKRPEEAIIVALKGRELGIPPMQAFAHIAVISGKPAMTSELMLGLIYQRITHAKIEFLETSSKVCRLRVTRPGEDAQEWSFTWEEASQANLINKSTWKQYPAAMLRARCISSMARAKFPDALMGVSYTPEELGAEVNEEGEVIRVEADSPPETTKTEEPSPMMHESTLSLLPLESKENFQLPEDIGEYVIGFGEKMKGVKFKDLNAFTLIEFHRRMKNEYKLNGLKHREFYAAYKKWAEKQEIEMKPD